MTDANVRKFLSMLLIAAVASLALAEAPTTQPTSQPRAISAQGYLRHIEALGDPNLAGRLVGSAGAHRAGEYVAEQFQRIGLVPAGDDEGWFQSFSAPVTHAPTEDSVLRADEAQFQLGRDFMPMACGATGAFSGPLVFAGYGLQTDDWDDLAGLDVTGAVLMVFRYEPHDAGLSRLTSDGQWSDQVLYSRKAEVAAAAGARALLVVTPPTLANQPDVLDYPRGTESGPIPMLRISIDAADALLASAGAETTVASLERQIARDESPASLATDLRLRGRCGFTSGVGRNVLALLPATDDRADRYLVVSAHYDHIGATGVAARDRGPGVRPGANDNASGVSSMLLIAEALARQPQRNHHTLLVAFDGEEMGFLGSYHFLRNPPISTRQIDAVINLDMTGYSDSDTVYTMGNIPAGELAEVAVRAGQEPLELTVVSTGMLFGGSDHVPFNRRGIAALTVCTGPEDAYHTRLDTVERIDADLGARVTQLGLQLWRHCDTREVRTSDQPDRRRRRSAGGKH